MKSSAEVLVEDGLLTIPEAANFSGLQRSMLYKLMTAGRLPYCKIGRSRRIPRRALIVLCAGHLVGHLEG
jgi:excisionase family DNA binding protein